MSQEPTSESAARMGSGIVYCAVGEKHRHEVNIAARTARKWNDVPVTLFVDVADGIDRSLFSDIRYLPEWAQVPRFYKFYALMHTPYWKTLYLDTDTLVLRSVEELFEGLDRFDVMICHALARHRPKESPPPDVPFFFPELNGGVMAFNNAERVRDRFVRAWLEAYRAEFDYCQRDQRSLRRVLYNCGLNVYILPPEFNFRMGVSHASKGRAMPVYIVHWEKLLGEGDMGLNARVLERLGARDQCTFFASKSSTAWVTGTFPSIGEAALMLAAASGDLVRRAWTSVWRRTGRVTGLAGVVKKLWPVSRGVGS